MRSFILFILYPLISLMSHEMGVKVMVFVSFFGIKKDGLRAGRAVLPKYFLEDVGLEMFKVLRKAGKRIGVSDDLPQVMIEGFLKDYLETEVVVGREMKVVGGYYIGIMEDKTKHDLDFDELVRKERLNTGHVIGITSFNTSLHRYLVSQFCQVRNFIYLQPISSPIIFNMLSKFLRKCYKYHLNVYIYIYQSNIYNVNDIIWYTPLSNIEYE